MRRSLFGFASDELGRRVFSSRFLGSSVYYFCYTLWKCSFLLGLCS